MDKYYKYFFDFTASSESKADDIRKKYDPYIPIHNMGRIVSFEIKEKDTKIARNRTSDIKNQLKALDKAGVIDAPVTNVTEEYED